jgi:hypothetical protein
MRSTHQFELEEVMAYLDGEISADRASEIAQHMQQCAECQELAASFRNLTQELSAWEIEPSPARLTAQISQQVAEVSTKSTQTRSARAEETPLQRLLHLLPESRSGRLGWALAGAMGVALVLISGVQYQQHSKGSSGYKGWLNKGTDYMSASRDAAAPPRSTGGKPIFGVTSQQAQREQLQELQKRMVQQEVASNLENNQADERYSVSVDNEATVAPAPPPLPPGASASTGPMIARTASLSLVARNFAGIEAAVKAVVTRHSGYIGELNTSTPSDAAKTLSATLRVPSAQLEPALAELKQLGRADQESQAGEEVTKQYVDLAARLKNSRATEERLLSVLRNNTGKVKDVLEVENEISRVRGEIEGMEADQRALQARIDFATITLSVNEEYKASLNGAPSSTGTRLHNAFVTGYHSVVENVVGFAAWLLESGPTLLLWAALLFFPIRWAWRRVRRVLRTASKPVAARA